MSKSAALGMSARSVDLGPSTRGRAVRGIGKVSKVQDNYLKKNKKKFNIISETNTISEKPKYRKDKRNESGLGIKSNGFTIPKVQSVFKPTPKKSTTKKKKKYKKKSPWLV